MIITMVGRLDECLLLAYRTPVHSVQPLLPAGLELIEHEGFAFWNIVVSHIDSMRPQGVPAFMGISYWHVAYRLYVRAKLADGSWQEGLYFVRSDADNFFMSLTGNLLTPFNFHYATILKSVIKTEGHQAFSVSNSADANGTASLIISPLSPPWDKSVSCFDSLEQAQHILKYQPMGLSIDAKRRQLNLAQVFRDESLWRENRVTVESADWQFFRYMNQPEATLELATQVDPINYRWQLGRTLPLGL